jgi:hypothetical protein
LLEVSLRYPFHLSHDELHLLAKIQSSLLRHLLRFQKKKPL